MITDCITVFNIPQITIIYLAIKFWYWPSYTDTSIIPVKDQPTHDLVSHALPDNNLHILPIIKQLHHYVIIQDLHYNYGVCIELRCWPKEKARCELHLGLASASLAEFHHVAGVMILYFKVGATHVLAADAKVKSLLFSYTICTQTVIPMDWMFWQVGVCARSTNVIIHHVNDTLRKSRTTGTHTDSQYQEPSDWLLSTLQTNLWWCLGYNRSYMYKYD